MVFKYIILVCLIISFRNKNKNVSQCEIIVSTEALVLESFIQFYGMTGSYFSKLLPISKKIN
jgi:hypothetical protein